MRSGNPCSLFHTWLAIASGLIVFGCQSSTPTESPVTGPMTATASFEVKDASRVPDSIDWSTGSDSGKGKPRCAGVACVDTVSLKSPLGSATMGMRLWAFGVRIGTVYFTQTGSKPALDWLRDAGKPDDFDLKLLSAFASLRTAKADSFAKLGKIGPSNLVEFYAGALLAKVDSLSGFPATTPIGMNPDTVKRALVLLGGKASLTWSKLRDAGLGLDSASVRSYMTELVAGGRITPIDSVALFPLYPVRVFEKLAMASEPVVGGAPVAVSGSFTWTKGRSVSVVNRIHTPLGVDSLHFDFGVQHFPSSSDTLWTFSGNVKIQANLGAVPGIDTLVSVFSDDFGNRVVATLVFKVAPPPPVAPKVVRVSPALQSGTELPFSKDSVFVSWRVLNWGDVNRDSVFIAKVKARAINDSTWGQNVFVAPTGLAGTIVFRVVGKNDSVSTDFVEVSRRKDADGPGIEWVAPSSATSVDAATVSYKVKVAVRDPSGVESVQIQGVAADRDTGDIWTATVQMGAANGKPRAIVVLAKDKAGNLSTDSSVSITRNVVDGATKPVFKLLQPKSAVGNVLPFDSATLHVVWQITDLSKLDTASILFNNIVPSRVNDSVWMADVPVAASGLPFAIVAQAANSLGNGSIDQLVVIRSKDAQPPRMLFHGDSHKMSLPFDSSSASLAWTVSDNHVVTSISLNGKPQALAEVVSIRLPLLVGENVFELVGKDSSGNESRDTVFVTRARDLVPPVVHRAEGFPVAEVVFDSTTALLEWTVSDNHKLGVVKLNGDNLAPGAKLSQRVGLWVGLNTFVLQVADSTGNETRDTVRLNRLRDMVPPSIKRDPSMPSGGVPFETSEANLAWTISDNHKVVSVSLDGSAFTPAASLSKKVTLSVGQNRFILVATDSTGNSASDTLTINRGGDQTAPVIGRTASTKDLSVPFDTTSVVVAWTVSDNQKVGKVAIGDSVVVENGGVYSRSVPLAVGPNTIRLVAADSIGNRTLDSVTVVRAKDATPPSIVRSTGTADRTLGSDSTSTTVSWYVSDNHWLKSVTIGESVVTGVRGLYVLRLDVPVGSRKIVIVATDSSGNQSRDSVVISRIARKFKFDFTKAASSSNFASVYGGLSFGPGAACPDCVSDLSATSDTTDRSGFLRLGYSIPLSGAGAYFANVGFVLPIDSSWSVKHDLRATTKIKFKARTTSTYAEGLYLKVNLNGPAFPFGTAGYTKLKTVAVTNDWTWYTITIKEFAYANWMKMDAAAGSKTVSLMEYQSNGTVTYRDVQLTARASAGKLLGPDSVTSPDYDNDSVNVLKNVQGIGFGIDPVYGAGGTSLDPDYFGNNQNKTLDIDSLMFVPADTSGGRSTILGAVSPATRSEWVLATSAATRRIPAWNVSTTGAISKGDRVVPARSGLLVDKIWRGASV